MTDGSHDEIVVSAIVFRNADGAVLTVRKRGTSAYMLPGGKPELGESAAETAAREVREELDIAVDPVRLRSVGVFRTMAANEADTTLIAHVFACDDLVTPRVQAELDDAIWVRPADAIADPLQAPLNREHVFPALVARS